MSLKPIKIIDYQCPICRMKWGTEQDAWKCIARGPGREYPIGCIYGNHEDGIYQAITFAVATNNIDGHGNYGASWACRNTGAGDSLGRNMCGGNSLYLNEHMAKMNPKADHFKRMVKYLRDHQIEITVWAKDGAAYDAIPYATYMKRIREGI